MERLQRGRLWTGPVSLTIPVGVSGFTGSGGATATKPLVGNVNVRNYNSGGFTSTINDTSTTQIWTNGEGQRLDRQEYILPPEFASQVLTSVTITDTGSYDLVGAMFSGLTVSTRSAYVVESITISSGKVFYDPSTKIYLQKVALTNAGTTAVNGPLFLILQDLSSGVTLANKSAATACFEPIGSRYVVALPEGPPLAPNTTVVVTLAFSDPSGVTISYTPLAAGSLGGAP